MTHGGDQAAVAAGFTALGDDDVRATVDCPAGLVQVEDLLDPASVAVPARRAGSGPMPPSVAPTVTDMAEIVLRIRLVSGDRVDVTWIDPDTVEAEAVEHVIATLAEDSGVLRSRHGDRLMVLYGRGVAAVEVAPRGAIV
jgi:hypothetical protein